MNKTIDVEEILAKYSSNFYLAKSLHCQEPGTLIKAGDVKLAIKEIVEAVIDNCAKRVYTTRGDKEYIKRQINYE